MDYPAARKELEGGKVRPVYLIHGKEGFFRDDLLSLLREKALGWPLADAEMNYAEFDGAGQPLDAPLGLAQTVPFLAERRMVVIVDAPFLASRSGGGGGETAAPPEEKGMDPALERYLAHPPSTSVLVFVQTGTVDRRRRAFRRLEEAGAAVECAPLRQDQLGSWIRARARALGSEVEPGAAEALAERLPADNLHLVNQELQKVLTHAGPGRPLGRGDVEAVAAGLGEVSIFRLVDAVATRDRHRALDLLKEALRRGEPPVRVLFMVARQLRLILGAKVMAERGMAPKEIETALGVKSFVARNCLAQGRHLSRAELVAGLGRVLEADVALKSASQEPRLALELCLVELTR